jgi:hypothetical protein
MFSMSEGLRSPFIPRSRQPLFCDFKLYPSVTTQKFVLLKIKIPKFTGAAITSTLQVHAPTLLLLPIVEKF